MSFKAWLIEVVVDFLLLLFNLQKFVMRKVNIID
jgi:hypothetical protein